MNIAIIPARGGSKRIPRKNIKDFHGKPLIAYSIEAALNSGCFDKVIVSTDDAEIADIARKYKAEVPFVRPAALSGDFTGTTPVMRHAIEWVQENEGTVEYACCIYATAPFIISQDLVKGFDLITQNNLDYAFSVTSYPFPIQRAIRITQNGTVSMLNPECFSTRSQDLEEVWHDAGQFYWGRAEAWCKGKKIFDKRTAPVILPRYRVQDIDTFEDWIRAELLFHALQQDDTFKC